MRMELKMKPMFLEVSEEARRASVDRMSFTGLIKLEAEGEKIESIWRGLIAGLRCGPGWTGKGMDLSLLAQMCGDRQAGLAIQREILRRHQLFRVADTAEPPRLRVLALAAATDVGGNTPLEFLLEGSGIELMVLYVVPGIELPKPLPDHDVAIVIASDSEDCREALRKIDALAPYWPRPLINRPKLIGNLDSDKLYQLLGGIEGLTVPRTVACTRRQLSEAARSPEILADFAPDLTFPLVVRPRGSHGGADLAKIGDCAALVRYLAAREEHDFFISEFVDYSGEDGLFRKYRIAFVDGSPFACHMAIADRWDIWYRSVGMSDSAAKRKEEEAFMTTFHEGFGSRHQSALTGLAGRLGLDYFVIDCAETKSGALLLFEADNTAVVHDLDSPHLFQYKSPQIRRIFDAFVAMLMRRSLESRRLAA
jgi:hypothetical protein